MKNLFKYSCVLLISGLSLHVSAQIKKKESRNLFSAGYAAAFIGGLYDAFYPYTQLKQHGDFGLGAPDKLDGEIIMLNGRLYQTRSTGKTTPISDTANTAYAIVCFFHATETFRPSGPMNKEALFHYLDSVLANKNGLYAIHIRGDYSYVKTRAFPPVQKPYAPLATMLDKQHFFEFHSVTGDLVGYRLPAFMEGEHIKGYHFHFLSDDKTGGGHIIDLLTSNITIEVETLNSYTLDLPQTPDFNNYDFKTDRREEIKSVENGIKK